jgi:signal transduction histidine kinase
LARQELNGQLKSILEKIRYPVIIADTEGNVLFKNVSGESFLVSILNGSRAAEGFSVDENDTCIVSLDKIQVTLSAKIHEWPLVKDSKSELKVVSESFEWNDWNGLWLSIVPNIIENEVDSPPLKNRHFDDTTQVFLANISHEIRTPLNGIIGFAELLLKKNLTPEKQKNFLNIIYNNGQHLLKLINDMLDLSRIESGNLKLFKTSFSINRLLYDLQLYFLMDLKNRNKENIMLKVSPGLPDGNDLILADELRIKQVIINLVSNAIKFSTKGQITIGYKIQSGDMLEFFIADTGIGMSESALQNIFKRFQQANETISVEFGGTGLGLTISKEFVELHHGQIWAESTINEGSSFFFTIPIR